MLGTKALLARFVARTLFGGSPEDGEGRAMTIAKGSLASAAGGLLTASVPAATGLSVSASGWTPIADAAGGDDNFAFAS